MDMYSQATIVNDAVIPLSYCILTTLTGQLGHVFPHLMIADIILTIVHALAVGSTLKIRHDCLWRKHFVLYEALRSRLSSDSLWMFELIKVVAFGRIDAFRLIRTFCTTLRALGLGRLIAWFEVLQVAKGRYELGAVLHSVAIVLPGNIKVQDINITTESASNVDIDLLARLCHERKRRFGRLAPIPSDI